MDKYWTMLNNLEQFYEENVVDLQTYYRIKSNIADKMKEEAIKSELPFKKGVKNLYQENKKLKRKIIISGISSFSTIGYFG